MPDRTQTLAKILELIEPFNKKGVAVTESTRFAQDLEWDSLTVLDFVANVEDEFDVLISMNLQAEIETVGQLADAIQKLKS
jgi:acyl carrier protein